MPEEPARKPLAQARALDDPAFYPKIDTTDVRGRLRNFPLQCRDAWHQALAFKLPREYARVDRVVVAGVGGSAIGGDLLADLASLEESSPITVCRDYNMFPYVDENTLVLACSYSGNTEETLSAFRHAIARGAKIIAVTGGGALATEASQLGLPLLTVGYKAEPRNALGYSFIVPTVLLMKLGLIADKTRDFEEAVDVLERLVPELAEESALSHNPAKQIALELLDRFIIIYGAGIFSGVARRWKTQLNENSKVWAFFELLPEAHHNSVMGYSLPAGVKGQAFFILLRPGFLHPRMHHRYQVTQDLLEKESIPQRTIEGRGESALSQMLSVILLGDYASYYLALIQGVDPSPISNIDFIKKRVSIIWLSGINLAPRLDYRTPQTTPPGSRGPLSRRDPVPPYVRHQHVLPFVDS